jgi:hypothetical protein
LCITVVGGSGLAMCAFGGATAGAADSVKPAHWRVVWKADPTTTATVSWDTELPGKSHRVLLRREGSDEVQAVECQRDGEYSGRGNDPTWFYHHARLTDLEPGTKYFVTLASDGERSPEMFFVTAPGGTEPFALIFGGDSRSGHEARRKMNAMLARLVAEQSRADRPTVVALAHGGDYIAQGRNLAEWIVWLTDHEGTVGPDGRLLPIIPTRGNHDLGPAFNEVFDFPKGDENFYALSFGKLLRLVTLNTETSTAGEQEQWLATELAQARPMHRWLVAQYHKPAFPAVKVPSGAYVSWVPLFEEYNVDLVCEADGHCIKRTAPIRNNKIDLTGVVYIGEGGLGVGQRTPKKDRWYLNTPQAKTGVGHHVQLLTITPDTLTCRVIMLDGSIFDETVLEARAGGAEAQ